MYKSLKMYRLSALIILIIIMFSSCGESDRKQKTNEEILKENKLLDSFTESVKYIPETYSEVETDTILNNGFRVKIKTYTEMQDNVLNEFVIDTIKYRFHYRNYTGKLDIFYNNTSVLKETINKSYLNKNKDKTFWDDAIMAGIYLDEHSSTKEEVIISVLYCIPESEICKEFNIIIDKKGNTSLEELESEPIH